MNPNEAKQGASGVMDRRGFLRSSTAAMAGAMLSPSS